MRARVILPALALLAGCGEPPPHAAPDAATPADASRPDACVPGRCEPSGVVATEWIVDHEQTTDLVAGIAARNGLVIISSQEILRFTDDGVLTVRRRVPDDWDALFAHPGPDGDVLVVVETRQPSASTRLVRLDGESTDELWSYVLDPDDVAHAIPTSRTDGSIAVVSAPDLVAPPWDWSLDIVDSDGTGTKRTLEMPTAIVTSIVERPDGLLFGDLEDDRCQHLTIDPVQATVTLVPYDIECRSLEGHLATGHLALAHDRDGIELSERVVTIRAGDGTVIAGPTVSGAGLVSADMMIRDGRVVSVGGGWVYHAPLTDLANMWIRTLPLRPGASTFGSVLGSDGDRAFVAWLDQVSTFDTVLRVARLGAIE